MFLKDALGSVVLMVAEARSKAFFAVEVEHGKSPCFLRCSVLSVVGVGWRLSILDVVDGGFFLD